MTSSVLPPRGAATSADGESAAVPLATGFALGAISLLFVVIGAVQVPRNDDWTLVVLPAVLAFVIGVVTMSVGIARLVRNLERAGRVHPSPDVPSPDVPSPGPDALTRP